MLSLGQVLKGKIGSYKFISKLQDTVWLATHQPIGQKVVIEYVDHFRVRNERDLLTRFQHLTPHLRPLLDEVELDSPAEWPALVLRYLDEDLLACSSRKNLPRSELKRVGKAVLKALEVLHGQNLVHTDIKPSNILVNHDPLSGDVTDVQLADLENTVSADSKYATEGDPIGTPMFRSTEATLQMQWGTATDVWSFGTMMISLLYGGGFYIFKPDVPADHEDYDVGIFTRHHQCFGPFPLTYGDIADEARLEVLTCIMEDTPPESMRPFRNTTNRAISEEDKRFVLKIMKLDPRDRPSVRKLLLDEWFQNP